MTRAEWLEIVARMRAWWPSAPIPRATQAVWFDDLKDQDAGQVLAAAQAFYRDGAEWPPTGAKVLGKLAELTVDAPPFDSVWRAGLGAARRFGRSRPGGARNALVDQVGELAADFIVDDWQTFCLIPEDGLRTQYAQSRDAYAARCRRAVRQITYMGIAPAGLPALQREPRTISDAVRQLVEQVQ